MIMDHEGATQFHSIFMETFMTEKFPPFDHAAECTAFSFCVSDDFNFAFDVVAKRAAEADKVADLEDVVAHTPREGEPIPMVKPEAGLPAMCHTLPSNAATHGAWVGAGCGASAPSGSPVAPPCSQRVHGHGQGRATAL